MPRKENRTRKSKARDEKNLLWIAPRYRVKASTEPADWGARPTPNRLIELADTALELWEFSAGRSKVRKTA